MEIFNLIVNVLKEIWPIRQVQAWERGFYTVMNRPWRAIGPGIWPIVPLLMDVRAVSVVPAVIGTPLQTITLANGKALSFSATATLQVEDAKAAILNVDNFSETSRELLSSIVAEKLAEVDPERFESLRRRRNLLAELQHELDEQMQAFGVRVHALRFNNFSLSVRTYRLLQDTSLLPFNW